MCTSQSLQMVSEEAETFTATVARSSEPLTKMPFLFLSVAYRICPIPHQLASLISPEQNTSHHIIVSGSNEAIVQFKKEMW